jgi:uncharacterized protein YhbP (UPF0306 family)
MGIRRPRRPVATHRIASLARQLLDASTLCAIATVDPRSHAHINTAYFAWTLDFDVVWLSEPGAKHSRNIRANDSVAVAVYDSTQTWGRPDRGIQLFGAAREIDPPAAGHEELYATRFPTYSSVDESAYRFYVLRTARLKLFDESELGPGVFVTARVARGGKISWERTEIYLPDS